MTKTKQTIIDIGIPIDLAKLLDTRCLIQAGSGGGKSYTQRRLIEAVGNKVQQIIIDPEGEYVTLREKFDFALVAKGGDIPLSLKYAEILAHKLLETGMSAIIDLYELKHHERILFVKRFLDAMMNAPKELWHSCLVYVDEAHIFCPESSKAESMSAVIDLCTRGRKRGFAAILATQRLSKLHKDAAAECNNKLIGRTGLDIDRKRAGEELGMTVKQELLNLRDLLPGEFHAFGPAISTSVVKFKVSKVLTTHPQAGKRLTSAPPTPDAIKKILGKLQDIPEEAERELATKQQLQAEVTKLRGEVTRLQKNPMAPAEVASFQRQIEEYKNVIKEKEVTNRELDKKLKSTNATKTMITKLLRQALDRLELAELGYNISISTDNIAIPTSWPTPANQPNVIEGAHKMTVKFSEENTEKKLGKCSLAILQFLATFNRGFSKTQIGVGVNYSPTSSGFKNSLSELNTMGLILRQGDKIELKAGADVHQYLGDFTPQKYSAHTFKNKLGKCEREIYDILLANPNDWFDKEILASKTSSGYSPTSSGYKNSLSALATLELIDRDKGLIKLNPDLIELL